MQNLDWNKCFQQVRGVELHFPFVRGLAVGLYWDCLRPTTQRAAQPPALWARLTARLLGRERQAPRGASATAPEAGPSSARVDPATQAPRPSLKLTTKNPTEERPLKVRSLSNRL